MIRTKEVLAQVLHARGLFELERRSRAGDFDDFESTSPTPISDLVACLEKADHRDLALRAREGEWDCSPEEAEEWMRSKDGRAAAAELAKGKDD